MNPSAARVQLARRSWEEAGDNLFTAIPGYLDALSKLNDLSATPNSPVDKRDLVSSIDEHLAKLDTLINSRALLNQLRNRHNALVNTLPVEILTHIFHIFIDQAQPILVHDNSRPDIYQRTTALVSVCHQWRRIALDSPTLWSLVPLIERDCERENNPLLELWLERGADVPLHLVICHQRNQPIMITPMLATHASRFRTLSLVIEEWGDISKVMKCWLDHGVPGSVTELSVSMRAGHMPLPPFYDRLPWECFLRPLRVLRLNNVFLDWNSAAFEGLLEFRLDNRAALIDVPDLARVLIASPDLNTLVLSEIRFSESSKSQLVPISLPCLRTLYLGDVSPDDLDTVLRLIKPGPYDVHLNFSATSLPPDESGGPMNISGLRPVFPLLQEFDVSTLSLEDRFQPDDLRTLLQSLPRLHTIYLHDADKKYDAATLGAMTKPQPEPGDAESTYASLRAIHLVGIVKDREAFKTMVSSHSLDQLSLGGWIKSPYMPGDAPAGELGPTDELCPYIPGVEFRLNVSSPTGATYEAQVTVIDIYPPFTMSSVMRVSLDSITSPRASSRAYPPFDLPPEMILKVYDRRFAYSLREDRGAKLPTYESETAYHRYVATGRAPQGVPAINAERKTYFDRKLSVPPELLEHLLATKISPYFDSECAVYKHLSGFQGRYIPVFYGSTQFISGLSIPDLDPPVRGVLLEVIPGINLDTIQPQSVDLDALISAAMHIVDLCGDMGVLNKDVRLGNFLVKPDASVVMIDFALARLRSTEEDDLAWKRAKCGEDEEGCVGYVAQMRYQWPYVPTRKYGVMAEGDD